MSGCRLDSRSRIDRTRREEREYSRILCAFVRGLDEQQRRQTAADKRERALSESEAARKQIESELIAGADSLGVAHESADSVQEMESSASSSCHARKVESESKARERYRLALSKLSQQKTEQQSNKHRRIQLVAPRCPQERTFNAISEAIEAKRQQRREIESCPKLKPTNDAAVKKYTLSYVNVYSASRKYKVEKTTDKEVKAADAAVAKNAETERQEAESAMQREEQLERARLRGKHADHVNKLEKNRQEILKELSFYQKKELQQKRTNLDANIPIEPPFAEKRAVQRRKQRELETQFEKLFIPSQDPAGPCDAPEEKALIGETKLRDLISQQKYVCSSNGAVTDDSVVTSLQDYSSHSLSVFALSATATDTTP